MPGFIFKLTMRIFRFRFLQLILVAVAALASVQGNTVDEIVWILGEVFNIHIYTVNI